MGFHIFSSGDIRQLAAQYSRRRQNDPDRFYSPSLFVREKIVIPSRSMRQWLERTLLDQGFFLANVEFYSTRSFISEVLATAGEDGDREEHATGRFGRKTMVWRIMDVLRKHPAEFPELTDYLESRKAEESLELRRYSLADKIAALLCRYIEETPELLARPKLFENCRSAEFAAADSFWNADHWQAKLWRRLCQDDGDADIPTPADRIMEFLTGDAGRIDRKYRQPVTVFGVGSMAPAALAVLKKLAQVATVNFFCLNPADAHWKKADRERWVEGKLEDEPEAVKRVFESQITGQWAQHQRQFFKTVLGLSPVLGLSAETFGGQVRAWDMPEDDLPLRGRFAAVAEGDAPRGVLQGLQKKLRDPDAECSTFELDDTITIHNCHSPAREVEILHDHLLHLIQSGKYTNSEILVAAPDITIFEPYVKAVFDQPVLPRRNGDDGKCLSYSFSGLGVHQSNPLAETFLTLLDIGRSRYELSQIERLLSTPEVRNRFGLEDDDLQNLGQWCRSAGIYWGADGEREKKFGVPDYESFSWRYGLDRMLLGFALEDDGDIGTQWREVAPFDNCDSLDGRGLMRALLAFFRDLRKTEELTDFSGPVEEWKTRLYETISTFFTRDLDRKAFYRGLVSAVNFLCAQVENAGYRESIPCEVIRRALADLLSVPAEDEEFLNGRITFCNLSDARSIPCKVLCLLGMDENAFPSSARPDSFDLIRRRMDDAYRSSRFQDRYFFLESLLGVRDYLLIYYRGRDDVMDREFSPATVITELAAYIARIFPRLSAGKLEIKHSLLPYSHDYFKPPEGEFELSRKWSFNRYAGAVDTTLRAALKAAVAGERTPRYPQLSFRTVRLQSPDPSNTVVTVKLSELEEFFRNAGYVFLKNSFSFPEPTKFGWAGSRDEPIDPDSLAQWSIKDFLSRQLIEDIPSEAWRNRDMCFQEIDGTDEILERCHQHFCRMNRLAPGGGGLTKLKALASASWIDSCLVRDAWREYCRSRENRQLQLEFDHVVQLPPDEPLCTDYPTGQVPDGGRSYYSKVILQYSTKKPKDAAQVMLTLGSRNVNKYRSRIFLRHLFFTAAEEHITSYLVSADSTDKYGALSSDYSRARLQKILSFYLYGRKHPLPIMEMCMWSGDPPKCYRKWNPRTNSYYGDYTLPYARLLWGDELDDALQYKIMKLQELHNISDAFEPNATPTE